MKNKKALVLMNEKKFKEYAPLIHRNQITVLANGCFDVFHYGHLKYLKKSKEFGDFLIVAINSDESIKKLKGPKRPFKDQYERAEIVSSIYCVDLVVLFDSLRITDILDDLKPNVWVKGDDYSLESIDIGERECAEKNNVEIKFVNAKHESTTEFMNRVKGNI